MTTSSTSNKMTNDLGAATNSRTAPPGDKEAMTKAMARPCRVGRLVNHHRAYSAKLARFPSSGSQPLGRENLLLCM